MGTNIFRGLNGNQTKPVEMRKSLLNAFRTRSSLSMSCFLLGGDNILDFVMSNEEGFVENVTIGEPFGTSDHCVIKWDMVIKKIINYYYYCSLFVH